MEAGPCVAAILALLSFLLLIPVFCWHLGKQNIPVLTLVFWMMFSCLTTFINLVLWSAPDFYNKFSGKVYCDITNKLEIGSNIGRICAGATLALNLYMILKARNPLFLDEENRRRKNWLNFALCWINPIFTMATAYLVQTLRFLLIRYRGCTSLVSSSYPSVLIIFLWQILWSLMAVVFAILTLYQFYTTRRDVKNILRCTNCGLSFKRFARLVVFSVFCVVTLVPLTIYTVVITLKNFTLHFEWKEVHSWTSHIILGDIGFVAMYDKLIVVGVGFITFLIFGVGSEASALYFKWIRYLFNRKKETNDASAEIQSSQVMQQPQLSDLEFCTRLNDLESTSYSLSLSDGNDKNYEVQMDTAKKVSPTDITIISLGDREFYDSEILEGDKSPGDNLLTKLY